MAYLFGRLHRTPVQRAVAPTVASTSKACSFSFVQRASIVTAQQSANEDLANPESRSRPRMFIGPLQPGEWGPGEWARYLVFAERAAELASKAILRHLDNELVDLLATNLNSRQGQQTL